MRRFASVIAMLGLLAMPSSAWAKAAAKVLDPLRLEVPGHPDAFYYRPKGRGLRPVIVYLHGRGGNPMEDCRKWAKVATQFGWVVCPSGQVDKGAGARAWNNDAIVGGQTALDAVKALRVKYKGRVQARGNVLVGFSEGAFVAMQAGLHDPVAWSRWMILAANDQYWFGDTSALLDQHRRKIKAAYLLTGESDEVAPNTLRVDEMLKQHRIVHKTQIVPGMGHEVPADRMVTTYRRPLLWLMSHR